MLFAISITFIHPSIPASLHPLFPKAMKCFLAVQEETKSLARRHPEEEKGLNIIICVVVVSMQLIKVQKVPVPRSLMFFSCFQGLEDELRECRC